jgi:hypothetical protein
MQVVVEASKTGQKAHDVGIFAQFKLLVKDDAGRTAFILYDGVLRKSKDGNWWVSPPAKKVDTNEGEKWLKHWYLYPDDRDVRFETEQWIVNEVIKQIGDPNVPGDSSSNRATSTSTGGNKSRAPFAPTGGKPAGGTGRVNSPFSGSSITPGGDGFPMGGN